MLAAGAAAPITRMVTSVVQVALTASGPMLSHSSEPLPLESGAWVAETNWKVRPLKESDTGKVVIEVEPVLWTTMRNVTLSPL